MAADAAFAGKGGLKLDYALEHAGIDVRNLVAADLGAAVGGFTDCLLKRGAAKVYSVDTCYGTLAWALRNDPRVVVMERTNALHVRLPESAGIVVVDVAWTPQVLIAPKALELVADGGIVLSLLKPQYEAEHGERTKGIAREECVDGIIERVAAGLTMAGMEISDIIRLPKVKRKNQECFFVIRKR
ncbi:MAG TPA: SAM-dependent methyltransferase [Candidatus Brocadiia bacterium]|nr:SAM-dependent methyltransferase [Candidatus Brocadiia bacterium]